MNNFLKLLMTVTLCASVSTTAPAYADNLADTISDYVDSVPALGLVSDTIRFDGIEIKNFKLDDEHKYIFVKPGEAFTADMDYVIDADLLRTLHLHHFIIGLQDDGPQACILHSLGIMNGNGHVSVNLKAPPKKGVYQVRFCHTECLTDQEAFKAWWRGDGPSSKTIMGIVIVK